jgi:DGQHR domain-containing protein
MPNYEYRGIKVDQQPGAPPFYMTSAAAAELLEWCDVPRAKGDYMAGYQRTLEDKRIDDLATYLRLSENNIIPGAVIVAVDADYVSIEEIGDGLFSISISEDVRDPDTKLAELWGAFTTRLSQDELSSADIHFTNGTGAERGGETVDATSDEATAPSVTQDQTQEDVVSLPDEPLSDPLDAPDFAEALESAERDADESEDEEDAVFPTSYLASLAKELSAAVTDWDSVPQERQKAIRAYIDGVSKPGLIIDGQHRVFGAKNVSEHDVHLPVVLVPGLAFAEQVFQFYVLNSKAKPLRPTELRRIVSTSLTNAEIADLYQRFKGAGIEAEEARWTLLLNTHPSSPFQRRIDFGFGETGAVIPENVADQVVRAFMKMPRSRYSQLIDPLGEIWEDVDKRIELFFWFWNAIKENYADAWAAAEEMADKGEKAQLFMKVALLTLQTFLLDRFVTALPYRNPTDDPPLLTEAEVGKMVKSTLTYLPSTFFEKEWKLKQIDTSEGRKELYAFMEAVWNNQGKMHGNLRLFRG